MSDRYKSILMFGSPGTGKGTQGSMLKHIPGFNHVACGDIFRSLDPESELGRKFKEYSSKGELVPDDMTIQMWRDYMKDRIDSGEYDPESQVLILDGIPRNLYQAEHMQDDIDVIGMVHLVCSNLDTMVERMKIRALKQNRTDDADEAVIRNRFEVYRRESEPVLGFYDPSLTIEIQAIGTPAEVLSNVLAQIAPIQAANFNNPLG